MTVRHHMSIQIGKPGYGCQAELTTAAHLHCLDARMCCACCYPCNLCKSSAISCNCNGTMSVLLCVVMSAGQLQVIILHSKESGEDEDHSRKHLHSTDQRGQQPHVHALDFYLKLPTGEMKKLRFPKQPKQVSVLCANLQQCVSQHARHVESRHAPQYSNGNGGSSNEGDGAGRSSRSRSRSSQQAVVGTRLTQG